MLARPPATLVALVLVLTAAACSSGGGSGGELTVTDAWVRPPAGTDMAGAAYLTILNGTDEADALVGVSTPAATTAELHHTMTDGDGMTGMQPVERIDVPAGGMVTLEPGGFHVMLIGVTGELMAGGTVQLTLTFEHAGEITADAEVRAS